MTPADTNRAELETLAHDVREMRKELIAVHHEVAAALKALDCLVATPHVAGPSHCPTCGSALDHHKAMAGELLICAACGWSQFIDRREGALPATTAAQPIQSDPAPVIPWTS